MEEAVLQSVETPHRPDHSIARLQQVTLHLYALTVLVCCALRDCNFGSLIKGVYILCLVTAHTPV